MRNTRALYLASVGYCSMYCVLIVMCLILSVFIFRFFGYRQQRESDAECLPTPVKFKEDLGVDCRSCLQHKGLLHIVGGIRNKVPNWHIVFLLQCFARPYVWSYLLHERAPPSPRTVTFVLTVNEMLTLQ